MLLLTSESVLLPVKVSIIRSFVKIVTSILIVGCLAVSAPDVSYGQTPSGYSEYFVIGDDVDVDTALEAVSEQSATDTSGPLLSILSIASSAEGLQVYLDRADTNATNGGICLVPPCYNFDPENPAATADAKWDVDATSTAGNEQGAALGIGDILTLCNDPNGAISTVGCDYGSGAVGEAVVGGDRLYITGAPVSMVRTVFMQNLGAYLAGAWEIYPANSWDSAYTVPVGVDLNPANAPNDRLPFQYVYLFIQPYADSTAICLNGAYVTTLDKGEDYSLADINTGDRVTAFLDPVGTQSCDGSLTLSPLQAVILTSSGNENSIPYSARFYTLTPETLLGNQYYIPTPTQPSEIGDNDFNGRTIYSAVYVYAFQDTNLIVEKGQGTDESVFERVSLSEGDVYRFVMPSLPDGTTDTGNYGAFVTTDNPNDKIWALVAGDDEVDLPDNIDGAVVDWGYQAIDYKNLVNSYFIPLAPANPLHIVATADDTLINVDWDNDGTIDQTISLDRLDTYMLFPPPSLLPDYNYNGSGAYVYSDTKFAMAWGQDNEQGTNNEAAYVSGPSDLDFGYAVLPINFPNSVDAVLGIEKTVSPAQLPSNSPGTDPITYTLEVTAYDSGLTDVDLCDELPSGLLYIAGTTRVILPDGTEITDTPVSTDPAVNTLASDAVCGSATALYWDMSAIVGGTSFPLAVSNTVTVEFKVQSTVTPYAGGVYTNVAVAVGTGANNENFRPTDRAYTAVGDLQVTKTASAIGPLIPGQIVDYTVTIQNLGSSAQSAVTLSDELPTGLSYVSESTAISSVPTTTRSFSQSITDSLGDLVGPDPGGIDIGWIGDWITSGNVTTNVDGNAELAGNGTYMYRQLDLSSTTTLVAGTLSLSFEAEEFGSTESTDIVTVEICTSSTRDTCTTLWSETGGLPNFLVSPTVSIADSYQSSAFLNVKLEDYVGGDEFVAINNIKVTGSFSDSSNNVPMDNITGNGVRDLLQGQPCCLITNGDGIVLAPTESITVSYRARVKDPLDIFISDITNSARADSNESPPVRVFATNELVPGSIGNRVWLDLDGDGKQDANEDGVAGVEVELLTGSGEQIDTDFSTPGIQALTTLTGPNGEYVFSDLVPGNYQVRVNTASSPSIANLDPTYDEDGGVTAANNNSGVIELSSNEEHLSADFGYGPLLTGAIGDVIYVDANDNGQQDAGEVGIANVSVAIYATETVTVNGVVYNAGDQIDLDPSTAGVQSTTKDARGNYLITDLPAGSYQVVVNPDGSGDGQSPSGYVNGTNPGSDPDGTIDNATIVTLAAGEINLDQNFAYRLSGSAPAGLSIGNQVFLDNNSSGTYDSSDTGIALLFSGSSTSGTPIAVSTTDATGQYQFAGLVAGDYTVQVVGAGSGYALSGQTSDPSATVDNGESCGGSCSLVNAVTLTATASTVDYDATFTSGGYTATGWGSDTAGWQDWQDGTTFNDSESGELGGSIQVTNNRIEIVNAGGADSAGATENDSNPDADDDTEDFVYRKIDLSGASSLDYSFDYGENGTIENSETSNSFLDDDAYVQVCSVDETVTAPTFTNCVNLEAIVDELAADNVLYTSSGTLDSSTYAALFSSSDVAFVVRASGFTRETFFVDNIDLTVNIPGSGGDNVYQDFGFTNATLPSTGNIGARVWLDIDGDGVQDASESGLSGVKIDLYNSVGTVVASTYTDPNGNYLFAGVTEGADYRVAVDASTLPAGLHTTYDEDGQTIFPDGDSGLFTLNTGTNHTTSDFGYMPTSGSYSIGDTIWLDADGDGQQDVGEAGLSGVTVGLYALEAITVDGITYAAGAQITTTTTNSAGNYLFTGLPEGAYRVVVNPDGSGDGQTPGAIYSSHDLGDPDVRDGTGSSTADNETDVILRDGRSNFDADFAYRYAGVDADGASIGDQIFYDLNGDGDFDSGSDSGISGVTVTLLDSGGNPVATTITDNNGNYQFSGLPAGEFTISVTDGNNVLQGLTQTSEPGTLDGGTACASCSSSNTLTIGLNSDNNQQDFGFSYITSGGGTGVIGDTIFLDTDNDGYDANEGIEGITVRLYNASNQVIDEVVTDESGNYRFMNLPAGDYTVEVDTTSLPDGGADWTNSIDPDTASPGDAKSTVTLIAGEINLNQDFGFVYSAAGANISGSLWQDDDGDVYVAR